MTQTQTRYSRAGELNIANHVVGEGLFDLVYAPGLMIQPGECEVLDGKIPGVARELKGIPGSWALLAVEPPVE